MSPRGHRWRLRVAWAAVSISLALSSLLVYWLVRPYDSVTFTPFRVVNGPTFEPGDIVELRNTFCWDGTPFEADRWLVSEVSSISNGTVAFPRGYAIERVAARYADGCSETTIKVDLPESMPPGEWAIEYRVQYKPAGNPIRIITVTNTSESFTVVPEGSR